MLVGAYNEDRFTHKVHKEINHSNESKIEGDEGEILIDGKNGERVGTVKMK